MSLNSHFFHPSLKSKVALSYLLLFFLSSCFLFAAVILLVWGLFVKTNDKTMLQMGADIQKEYLIGRRFDRHGELIPASECDPGYLNQIKTKSPGIEIIYIFRMNLRKSYYTVFACHNNAFYEMRIEPDGSLFSRKVPVESNLPRFRQYLNQKAAEAGTINLYFNLIAPDGKSLISTDLPPSLKTVQEKRFLAPAEGNETTSFLDIKTEGAFFRVMNLKLPDGNRLVIGQNINTARERFRVISTWFFTILLFFGVMGGIIGWFIARHFIRGIERVTRAVDMTCNGDYSQRVESLEEDAEIKHLMIRFNELNERTSTLMYELRTISDNVAHDLRTPLTRMMGTLEIALSNREQNVDALVDACVSVSDECYRMKELINTILEISRTNAFPDSLNKTEFDLNELLSEAHELMLPFAEKKNLEFKIKLPEVRFKIVADKMKTQRTVSNLLDNAFKFTPDSGRVELLLEDTGNSLHIIVRDSGCGISFDNQQHVFERFFRADSSRNHSGNGLGLSFVKSVTRAHHWQISLESCPGHGTTFILQIPKQASGTLQA